jgi:hypothetical protein
MREAIVKVYKYNELSDEAKKKALDWMRGTAYLDYEWYDFLIQAWKEKLENAGFVEPKIRFTGFWSQGDGASFDCKRIDIAKWLKAEDYLKKFSSLAKQIEDEAIVACIDKNVYGNNYCHERTRYVEISDDGTDGIDLALVDELEKLMEQHRLSLCEDIYKELEKEYEYLMSDEVVINSIETNGYEFEENGKVF